MCLHRAQGQIRTFAAGLSTLPVLPEEGTWREVLTPTCVRVQVACQKFCWGKRRCSIYFYYPLALYIILVQVPVRSWHRHIYVCWHGIPRGSPMICTYCCTSTFDGYEMVDKRILLYQVYVLLTFFSQMCHSASVELIVSSHISSVGPAGDAPSKRPPNM